ncbi:MAG: rod-binding protein [Alphaproteobacteria bacterium]
MIDSHFTEAARMSLGDRNSPESIVRRATQTKSDARQAAEEFESVFLSKMLDQMFAGIKTDGLFGSGPSGDIYRSMLNQEYGKVISTTGGIGIADQVEREILKLQELN